ncbi:hypothetical protein Tco_0040959 [Tanacetum coccineum]
MNYIPVSLENQANPHAGTSEKTNIAGTSQTPQSKASEEKDEDVELTIPEEIDDSRTSSIKSKKEKILTDLQQEKKDLSTDTSEDNSKIQAFRRELEDIALKHLGTVPENNSTSTPSVNTGSQTVNTGRLDHDDSSMPELEIFHKSETGIFDEASYDEDGVITDFNSLPTEIEVSPTPTLRIHSIHPKSQILGDPKSAVQTRSKVQNKSGAHALLSHIHKQQRNNHKDQQHCLFAWVFISWRNLKKIASNSWNEGAWDKKDIMLVQVYVDDIIFGAQTSLVVNEFQFESLDEKQLSDKLLGQEHDAVAQSQPSSSTPLVPSSSTPPVPSTSTPPVPSTSTPLVPSTSSPLVVPQLLSRIDSLETDLKQTKLTMGNALVKLVKKLKKLEGFLKRRNMVLSDSEGEEPEAQGRKSQDDHLDSLVQGLVTPSTSKVNASGEEQVEDISPNTLEGSHNFSSVASLKAKAIDKGRMLREEKR